MKEISFSKKRVAREAAVLLYSMQEKEYKQAKKRAAKTLGVRVLPSNREVAEEVDKIAEETEGLSRQKRMLQMRKEALQVLKTLESFQPKLVGSVWRGTAHKNSDIDVTIFSSTPRSVIRELRDNKFEIEKTERVSVTKKGKAVTSLHIYLVLPSSNKVEIVVKKPENKSQAKCEIYGDAVIGLSYSQLKKVLEESPFKRFTPK